jgi:hypothetical protein
MERFRTGHAWGREFCLETTPDFLQDPPSSCCVGLKVISEKAEDFVGESLLICFKEELVAL